MMRESMTQPRLLPLTKWNEYHPYPNIAGLRYLVFNADKNGFSSCIRRIGKRVLIDEAAYFAWVDAQQGNSASHALNRTGV